MQNEWRVAEGTGWISLGEFGEINPHSWGPGDDRQVATAKHPSGGFYLYKGAEESETFEFEFDTEFVLLGGADGPNLEIRISPLQRGQYAVRFRRWVGEDENLAWSGE